MVEPCASAGGGGGGSKSATTDTLKHWPDKPIVKLSDLPTGGRTLDDILQIPKGKLTDLTLRDTYKVFDFAHQNSPWYKDYHTYGYIALALAGTLCLTGVGMFVYGFISETGYFLPTNVPRPDANANPDGVSIFHLVKSVVRMFPNT